MLLTTPVISLKSRVCLLINGRPSSEDIISLIAEVIDEKRDIVFKAKFLIIANCKKLSRPAGKELTYINRNVGWLYFKNMNIEKSYLQRDPRIFHVNETYVDHSSKIAC